MAQTCESVFPDAASSVTNSATIEFQYGSQVIGSPDDILDTTDLVDYSGGVSCNGTACSQSGSLAEDANYNSFPNNQPNISLGYQATQTVSPGDYGGLSMGSQAVLTMEPGVYVFRDSITIGYDAEIVVASAGTVVIYANQSVSVNSSVRVNSINGDRDLFLFSRSDVFLNASSTFNGFIFARGDVVLNSGANVTGAVTARGDIKLYSASFITYDADALSTTDFDGWCESSASATLIHEWKFDESTGQNTADNVGSIHLALGSNISEGDTNDPEWICGVSGTALDFDASNTEYATSLSSFTPPDIGTVMFWFKTNGVSSSTRRPFSHSDGWETRYDSSGQLIFDLNKTGSNSTFRTNTVLSDTSKWYHIAAVYNSDADTYEVYVDGNLDKSGSLSLSPQSSGTLNFGRRTWGSSQPFDGALDEFVIYDGELSKTEIEAHMNASPLACNFSTLDHFNIDIGGGNASVCDPYEITISARDSSDGLLLGYTGTIDLTTSTNTGDWQTTIDPLDAQGTLTPGGSDSGAADYSFEASGLDQGAVVVALDNQHASSLTITVNDADEGVNSTSSAILFSENAFVISENDNLDNDVIAGRRHQFNAMVMERAPSGADDSNCVVATNYNETTVRAWINRSVSDPGGAAPLMNNADLDDSVSLVDTEVGSQAIDLKFSAGIAAFSLDTTDVGQFSIQLFDDSLNFSDSEIRGESQELTIRPFGFRVSAIGNPAASDDEGAIYLDAGDLFSVTVDAVGWHADDDGNGVLGADDGIPDIYQESPANPANDAQFSGNTLLSFGAESPAETIELTSSLYAPSSGTNAGLASLVGTPPILASSFSGGSATVSDIYYPDVGIIQINAALQSDYLGASTAETARANSASTYVGRFTPSYFELTRGQFDPTCGSFNYLSQPRSLKVTATAKNSRGATTANYRDAFEKLNITDGTVTLGAIDSVGPTLLSPQLALNGVTYNWVDGVGTIQADMYLNRLATEEGPYTDVSIGMNVTDADGRTLLASAINLDSDNDTNDDVQLIASADIYRSGRLVLPNAHGPESAILTANFATEYWSGAGWQSNGIDSCTQIAETDIYFPNGTIDSAANLTTVVGGSSSTASFADQSSGSVNFTLGEAGLSFSAPGIGNTGAIDVDINLTNYPWLQFNWDQNSATLDNSLPTAEFRFGSYRGHDRVIYWQEILTN